MLYGSLRQKIRSILLQKIVLLLYRITNASIKQKYIEGYILFNIDKLLINVSFVN